MSFTLQREQHISEINATVRLYTHDKTGARLLSVLSEDENKVFGVTFRTPPATSNGIAHIMEHSVLCGSRKYPVKEPFIELAKGSLNTFLNAMTYPDKTCYPVASTNLQDLYNLIDVYLDAVFYPLLPERTLKQEGWHYEIENPAAPLTYKGVVFNEMKGNYSSPDMMIEYEYSQRSLFPDTPYGLDSGGDPQVIPTLTYAEFKAFHETYYHPSNALFWFYGDDPEEKRLAYLDQWLNDFERREVRSEIPLQPRWDAPRKLIYRYDSGDNPQAKAYLTVNWLLPESGHPETLGLSILAHILTGTPASPLRKALIDSGLGEDVIGVGLEDGLRQMFYSVGMQGVEPSHLDQVESLILETLRKLANEGIDPETIAASLNTIEFRLREQNTGRFPRGLYLMLTALSTWLYDGDPFEALAFEQRLNEIKERLARGEKYFEGLIRQHLLENSHRATVHLLPDPEEGKRRAQAEAERLAKVKETLSQADLERIIAEAAELKRFQETPDSPEALATIPSLKLSDLEPKIKTIPTEFHDLNGVHLLTHPLATNGILYFDLGFDLSGLPADLVPYLGFFGRLLLQMGTQSQDYVRLIQRIGQKTGGIGSTLMLNTVFNENRPTTWFFLRGKALLSQADDLLAILGDVLLTARFDDRERFKQILLEEKAGMESGLIPSGHMVVNRRLRARFTAADRVGEQTGGVSYLFFLRDLLQRIDQDWDGVLQTLEDLRQQVIRRSALILNLTLDPASIPVLLAPLSEFVTAIPDRPAHGTSFSLTPPAVGSEALLAPSQVNFVGKGANLYELGYRYHGSIHVINNYLGTTYLWEKVRVQGGAYGGFAGFDPNSGVWTYLSYRDPNLVQTLKSYDGTADFLRQLELPEEERVKAIIGTIGDLDAYQLPDAKGWSALVRYLSGISDEHRQRVRDEVLSTSEKHFKELAEVLAELARQGEIVVLGSEETVKKANQELGNLLTPLKVL
jgi:Zn-dependent M16 (insulinase) family peptidase